MMFARRLAATRCRGTLLDKCPVCMLEWRREKAGGFQFFCQRALPSRVCSTSADTFYCSFLC